MRSVETNPRSMHEWDWPRYFASIREEVDEHGHVPNDRTHNEELCRCCEILRRVDVLEAELTRLRRVEEGYETLLEAIGSAMTSLATGPLKDGYAYSVLEEACERVEPAPSNVAMQPDLHSPAEVQVSEEKL
jgi:hypothetical protein